MNNGVTVLCDTENMGYDKTNPYLFAFAANRVFVHHYPDINGKGKTSIAGIEGDPVVIKVPLQLQGAIVNGIKPILNNITVSVLAIKGGKNDFVVESKIFNTATSCNVSGMPVINMSSTRGYITYANDPYNIVSLKNDAKYNIGTMVGLMLQYALVLRYDYWNPIVATTVGNTGCDNDINNDIPNITGSWSSLVQNGWNLVLRISADVVGYDQAITTYQADTPIVVSPIGSGIRGLQYTKQTIYYDDSVAVGTVIVGIKKGAITRIRNIWTPNGFALPGYYYGSIFIDIPNLGGVYNRRFASTELPSESGSPFSDPGPIYLNSNLVPNQRCYGNLRMGYYVGSAIAGTVITETNYNDIAINWSNTQAPNPVAKLGFKEIPTVIGDETGEAIGDEDGDYIGDD